MTRPTLLGFLAQFGSFSKQSEVLCTQGLTFLLQEHEDAHSALTTEVKARTGVQIVDPLTWKSEAVQDDKGRVDLEACTADGIPVVKIEAKLGAELTENQLQSYAADLRKRTSRPAALLVLVPKSRTAEAARTTAAAFDLSGSGPWRVTDGHATGFAVISWDELFALLQNGKEQRLQYDIEQLQAMYWVLSGDYIAPVVSIEEMRHWRERETDFVNSVDKVTRELTKPHNVLPMFSEPPEQHDSPAETPQDWEQKGYRLRYVSPLASNPASYYSIGVRDAFENYATPIWMRFHKNTGDFTSIRRSIEASSLKSVRSSGHIWIPLEVPRNVSGEQMVQALVEQAEKVVRVAYKAE